MKTSLNWLRDYLTIDLSPAEISEILTAIGLEVEGEEEIESIKGGLEGVVVGHVTECGQHPNADRLSLTKVDVGGEEDLQIVCGAPNVAKGQKVLVATVGTMLYDADGKGFKIKKGKIRGEASQGMICAEDELGLGDDHDGIIVLPDDVPVGTLAKDYYEIETDTVYEIGLTPNRSDATCHMGVAKDLAAALKINHQKDAKVTIPLVDDFKVDSNDMAVEVVVENTTACPRYTGVSIKGITIKESPDWLKNRLKAIGVRPISNIVDITNYVLHDLGQPLHAFDLDKITDRKVVVKTLAAGTKFLSLDEQERTLSEEDLMICDGASNGMCIGGVFGGLNSGVTDTTKNIFLEAAHFNAKWIRRSSTRHLLRTDAAKVFEKGSDPNVTKYALQRAAMLIKELAGGEIASEIVDIYPEPIQPKEILVRYERVNRLIGVDIPKEKVKSILEAMEMQLSNETEESLTVAIPTNKADVLREADVIEEILRIYGLNEVPISNTIKSSISVSPHPDPLEVKNKISDYLTALGYYEMMALSLSRSGYYKNILPRESSELVYVNNTSNRDLDIMRPDMLMSGLEAVLHNQNRQQTDIKLYEFGRSYWMEEKETKEREHLSIFLSGQIAGETWHQQKTKAVSYYDLKTIVQNVLSRMGIATYQESAFHTDAFSYGTNYQRGPQVLVSFGKVSKMVLKKMEIKQDVFYADFNWTALLKAARKNKIQFKELNKYPSTRRDLALVVENKVNFNDIAVVAKKIGKQLLKEINLFDVYENEEQLGAGKKSYAVSFVFEHPDKTLADKDVEKIMKKLIYIYENDLAAIIRK